MGSQNTDRNLLNCSFMKGDFSLSEQRDLINISRLRMLTGLAVCTIMSYGNVCISSVLIFADPLAISPLTFLSKRARCTYQFSGIILMRMFTEDSNNYDGLWMETITVCWIGQLKYKYRRKKSKCIAPLPQVEVCFSGQEQVQ